MIKKFERWRVKNIDKKVLCTIVKIDEVTSVVHVKISNLTIPHSNITEIEHMPFDYEVLLKSLDTIVDMDYLDEEEIEQRVSEWKQNKGGVWDVEIYKAIEFTKQTYMKNE